MPSLEVHSSNYWHIYTMFYVSIFSALKLAKGWRKMNSLERMGRGDRIKEV